MTGPRSIVDATPGAATSFDLHALLAELDAIVRPRAERRGLRLALVREDSVPGRIHADRTGLRRLLLVLLGDAVRLARAVTARPDPAIDLRVAVDPDPSRSDPAIDLRVAVDPDPSRSDPAIDLRVAVDPDPPRLRGRLAVAGASAEQLVRRDLLEPLPLADELARQLGGALRREADGLRLELPVALVEAAA